MVMAGSVRNAGDEARVEGLRKMAQDLGISVRIQYTIRTRYFGP